MSHAAAESKLAIVIHGGAGTLTKSSMTDEKEAAIRAALNASVQAGYKALLDGASSTDAVAAAINVMEDSPLFNAGKGAVFNAAGKHEMDASIMEGAGLSAGSVASVPHIRNPIDLAIKVMTESEHVMLMGEGAEEFARQHGFKMMDPSYFYTDFRWQQLQRVKARELAAQEAALQYSIIKDKPGENQSGEDQPREVQPGEVQPGEDQSGEGQPGKDQSGEDRRDQWYSTVGAVALDRHGNLAAGTSTGGTSNKRWGRVGDSPIIGAGTYADNKSCAVSATGHGEFFIRYVVAYNICNRVELGIPLNDAAGTVVNDILVKAGGEGGVIAIDHAGNIVTPFNSEGMYRASIDTNGHLDISIYREEGEAEGALTGNVDH